MPTIFISGANRGIGLEFVKQYKAAGWRILACCRHPDKADELNDVLQNYDNSKILSLDLFNDEDIYALTDELHKEKIDILLNNAGVIGSREEIVGSIDPIIWQDTFRVNTIAPMLVIRALLNQVEKSDMKIIANMSSTMGSISDNDSGKYYSYRSSKAALNAVTKSLSIDLKDKNITVLCLHPGWVQTDMGGSNALINAEESVTGLVKILNSVTIADTGTFRRFDGGAVNW